MTVPAVGTTTGGGTVTLTVPDAPTIGAATAGNTLATIAFTAGSNGGAAVTSFDATCTDGSTSITGSAGFSPVNVEGLTNGTTYSCSVTATNLVGTSGASGTVDVTPTVSTTTSQLPAEFSQFGNNVTVVFNASAGTVSLEAAGRPDHVSPYWDPDGTSGLYVAPGSETTVAQMSPGFIDEYTNMYFLTVSVDPQQAITPDVDTVAALRDYAKKRGIKSDKWDLVTGDRDAIFEVAKLGYFASDDLGDPEAAGDFKHTENVLLIDKNRRIGGIYNGLSRNAMDDLISDINALKAEEAMPQAGT